MHVVLVAPYWADNTLRYVSALTALPSVRLSVLTCDSRARLAEMAPTLAQAVHTVAPVHPSLSAETITAAARSLAAQHGQIDRLLAILEELQLPVGHARSALSIPGMTAAVAHAFRDKDRMKQVLRSAGLPVARSARVTHPQHARAFAAETGYPLILKPVAGVGSRSTYRVTDATHLEKVLTTLQPSESRAVQAEEFITGVERTLETVVIDGRAVWWSGTLYRPTPLQTLEHDWMQYTVTLPVEIGAPWSDFLPTGIAALRALGLNTGLAHMEWFETADGRFIIGEVGARPPGVNIMPLMSHAYGVDMVAAWCRLMVRGEWPVGERKKAAGSAFLRAQGRGDRVVAVHGLAEAQEQVGHLVVERQLPQVGAPVAQGYTGDGSVVVAADTTAEVNRALGVLVKTVRVVRG